jgi:F420-0:gamma-glutamyl ligase
MYRQACGLVLAVLVATSAAAQLAPQKSSQGGVSVAVTPMELAADAELWSFKVVLDTHSQDLSDDLAASAVLLDGQGRESRPIAWEGAAPGGHHREGVLKFNTFRPTPETVELRIARPGEPSARAFRWQLK